MQIRFDTAPDRQNHWFHSPSDVILATDPSEVDRALANIDAALGQGKWVAGFAPYELGYAFEDRLKHRLGGFREPLLCFGVYDGPQSQPYPKRHSGSHDLGEFSAKWDQDDYAQACTQVLDYIAAGDIYQANLTFEMIAAFHGSPFGLFDTLAELQSVKHGAFVDLSGLGLTDQAYLCRSPELFFRTDTQGRIETRPMKGTQPRHIDPTQDRKNREFLTQDEKNKAENLMIVDLLRNDISRICDVGSVKVPELFSVETYATVHQMTSLVVGQLQSGIGFGDTLRALFPCGSITGAPKVRAMEILHDLETSPRGIYCGTIGWVAPDGRSEFNVAIRTLVIQNDTARLNVGGGVVYDSTSASEYEEALWKARFATSLPKTAA